MSRALLPIFLIVVVDILGMTIILPLLPFYAEKMGASATTVGLLVSAYAICSLFGGPILGRMSDRWGRRPLLLVSQVGTLIGFIILASANTLTLVFLSRILDGFTAGNISLAQAYIADVTKPEERTRSFALIGIAFGLGFMIGPAISGFLSQFGYVYPILLAIGLSATSILATYFFLPATKAVAEGGETGRRVSIIDWGTYVEFFRRPGLSTLLWQFLFFIFSFSVFMSGFPLFAERRYTWNGAPFGPKEVGYVHGFIGVIAVIIQGGLLGRLSKRFGDRSLVRAGFIFGLAGFVALAFAYSIPALLVISALVTCGTTAIRPALTSLITQAANRSEQGSVLGLTQSLMSVSQVIGPILAGVLIDHGQLQLWCLAAGLSLLPGLMLARRGSGAQVSAATPEPADGHR